MDGEDKAELAVYRALGVPLESGTPVPDAVEPVPTEADPVNGLVNRRRCHAHNRQGNQCGQPAMAGSTVCRMHGGAAPAVRRKAQLRLLELVDPAVAVLAKEMVNPKARPIERIKAAEAVLDRAGHGPKSMSETMDGEVARQILVSKIMEMRADAVAEQRQIEGDVLDDEE